MTSYPAVDLTGRVALVTGAGRGIGRAIAAAYAAAGAAVTVTARTASEIDDAVAAITAAGGRALAHPADVRDVDAMAAAVSATERTFGGLDVVVANAGAIGALVPLADTTPDALRDVLEVNLMGVQHTIHAAVPALRRRGGGHVIVMGSGAGRRAGPGFGPYAASKAAASMLVRIYAQELRDDAIAVHEVLPGPVRTRMTGTGDLGATVARLGDDAATASLKGRYGSGEWVKDPDDVAPLLCFLASLPTHGPTGQTWSLLGRDL
jgi:3-oxoacyl-[acyl-carrier protein] reductase